jgi:hypothetical protein
MKKVAAVILTVGLCVNAQANAQGFFDSIKEFLGFGEAETETLAQPTADGLLSSLMSNLNVTEGQAKGGLASLLDYAKNHVNSDTVSQLQQQIPGLESVMSNVPDISNMKQEGLGGMLDKAAEYSESLKGINDLKKQFEAIGLEPQMIMQYVEQAKAYLDTEEGQQAKQLLMDTFSGLKL